jgi:serine/threonine protein kinase
LNKTGENKSAENICARCGRRRLLAERRGSLTSFLLSDLSCYCDESSTQAGDAAKLQPLEKAKNRTGGQSTVCQRCLKLVPTVSRAGSITAFFFKDQRCQCRKPLLESNKSDYSAKVKAPAQIAIYEGSDNYDRLNLAGLETRYHGGELLSKRTSLKTAMQTARANQAKETIAMAELAPGQIIGGCYELLDLAGQGGMGSVYKARHTVLGRLCAVKFLLPSMITPRTWFLFQKEAKLVSTMQHQTICQVYDLGIHNETVPYYCMDFVEGATLESTIIKHGPLSVGATLELFIKVCEGLNYAHGRGVVHKDLKPANLMITGSSNTIEIRILDFGIADLAESARESQGQAFDSESDSKAQQPRGALKQADIIGSASYMSPEQFVGDAVDRRSDIYSLGCVIFETLVGAPPFLEQTFEDLRHAHLAKLPPSLEAPTGIYFPLSIQAIIAKCLEKNPDHRYQSVAELSVDLELALAKKPLQHAIDHFRALEEGRGASQIKTKSNYLDPTSASGAANSQTGTKTETEAGTEAQKQAELPFRNLAPELKIFLSAVLAVVFLSFAAVYLLLFNLSDDTKKSTKQIHSSSSSNSSEFILGKGKVLTDKSQVGSAISRVVDDKSRAGSDNSRVVDDNSQAGSKNHESVLPQASLTNVAQFAILKAAEKEPSFSAIAIQPMKDPSPASLEKVENSSLLIKPLSDSTLNIICAELPIEKIGGLDMTAVKTAETELRWLSEPCTKQTRYLRIPVASPSQAGKFAELLPKFQNLQYLVYQVNSRASMPVSVPPGLTYFAIESAHLPGLRLSDINERHPSRTYGDLVNNKLVRTKLKAIPTSIEFINCDINERTFHFLSHSARLDRLSLKDCRLKECPIETTAVYGVKSLRIIVSEGQLPNWLRPEALNKAAIALPEELEIVMTTWSDKQCQKLDKQFRALHPRLRDDSHKFKVTGI